MIRQLINGNVINGETPLAVSVVQTNPGHHIVAGNVITAENPLAVSIVDSTVGLISSPPEGAYRVTNLYAVLVNGQPKLQVEYETGG